MKTTKLFLLLLAATITFSSCGDDDESSIPNVENTNWHVTYFKHVVQDDIITEASGEEEVRKVEPEYQQWIFKADGEVIWISSAGLKSYGTYEQLDEALTIILGDKIIEAKYKSNYWEVEEVISLEPNKATKIYRYTMK